MFKRSLPALSALALSIFAYSSLGENLTAGRKLATADFYVAPEVLETRADAEAPWDTYTNAELAHEELRWDFLGQESEDDPNEMPSEEDMPEQVVDNVDPSPSRMQIDVFRRPIGLGVDKEFMIVSHDHRPISAHVISTAKNGKGTVGDAMPAKRQFLAKIEMYPTHVENTRPNRKMVTSLNLLDQSKYKPYAWHVSSSYAGSTMYWGMQIDGAFWLHSTPHYADLGKPASMGCVRMSFPSAMRVFDLAVNQYQGNIQIQMHNFTGPTPAAAAAKIAEAKARWSELGLTAAWVNAQIATDYAEANSMPLDSKGDYHGVGHSRTNGQAVVWPKCADVDCFKSAPASAKTKGANPALTAPPAALPAPARGRI